ncbi:MAG: V-type ATP synthase subunit E [Sedimentibacter sp.]
MGIENITKNILNEADSAAEVVIKNAENTSIQIIEEANKQAEEIIKKEEQKAIADAEILKNRMISSAELQSRKMILSTKQQVIKNGFSAALNKLKEMPEDQYISYLVEQILNIPNCSGDIILNEKDKESIGDRLVKSVNDKLNGQKLKLSEKTIKSIGGFVLINGDIEINSTFETLLSSIKDELTNDVANALFD